MSTTTPLPTQVKVAMLLPMADLPPFTLRVMPVLSIPPPPPPSPVRCHILPPENSSR